MTVFDLIALAVVAFSALSGFNKGAAAEILGLFALVLSALATVAFLPATAPIARHFLHAGWVSAVVAAVVTFLVVFLFLRLLAGAVTGALNRSMLGGANRALGLLIGALRGVLILAVFALVFERVTPAGLKPGWITGGFVYPIAAEAGRTVTAVLPKTLDLTGGMGGALGRSIENESAAPDNEAAPTETASPTEAPTGAAPASPNAPTSERAKVHDHGYTRRARDSVDALVERSK